MRVKALVLDGAERILHVLRNLIPVHPDAVFAAADGRQLLIISVCILVIDNAGLIEREIVKIQIEARRDAGLYIECKDAHEDKPRHDADEQDRSDYAQNAAGLAAAFFGAGLLGNIHWVTPPCECYVSNRYEPSKIFNRRNNLILSELSLYHVMSSKRG